MGDWGKYGLKEAQGIRYDNHGKGHEASSERRLDSGDRQVYCQTKLISDYMQFGEAVWQVAYDCWVARWLHRVAECGPQQEEQTWVKRHFSVDIHSTQARIELKGLLLEQIMVNAVIDVHSTHARIDHQGLLFVELLTVTDVRLTHAKIELYGFYVCVTGKCH